MILVLAILATQTPVQAPIELPEIKQGEIMEVVSSQIRLCEKTLTNKEEKKERGRLILMPL